MTLRGANHAWVLALVALTGCETHPAPKVVETAKRGSEPAATSAVAAPQPAAAIDRPAPVPRPPIVQQPQVRPPIPAGGARSAARIGNAAVDAKWSNYGAYLQRMIEAVQREWDHLLIARQKYPGSGKRVTVKFALDADGKVAKIVAVDNESGEEGANDCVSAITNRSPYGKWTEEMKAVLGSQQEMTFTFYYR